MRDGSPLLSDVNLDVGEGEIVALLGREGCGHSTLLRAVAAMVPLAHGEITIYGKPVTIIRDSTRFIQGGIAFLPWKTVLENIDFTLRVKGYDDPFKRKRIDDMVREVGLEGVLNRYPMTLSRMQRLHVSLACTYAPALDHLMIDNPTLRLPAPERREMQILIRRLCQKYLASCAIATQDAQEAAFVGQRIALMKNARIIDVVENPYFGITAPWDHTDFIGFCASLREALSEDS